MKEILAMIRPTRYFETKRKLLWGGCNMMTSKEVLGRGKRKLVYETELQAKETVGIEFVAKRLLDIVVCDADVPRVIQLIMEANSTGHPGDGKIFVLPMEEAVRVRTGQRGDDVLV